MQNVCECLRGFLSKCRSSQLTAGPVLGAALCLLPRRRTPVRTAKDPVQTTRQLGAKASVKTAFLRRSAQATAAPMWLGGLHLLSTPTRAGAPRCLKPLPVPNALVKVVLSSSREQAKQMGARAATQGKGDA